MKIIAMLNLLVLSALVASSTPTDDRPFSEENQSLQEEVTELRSVVNKLKRQVNGLSEYCRLVSGGDCGPCVCRDDRRLVKKYFCDCQVIEPRRDCLDHLRHGNRISGIYKVHQNLVKVIQVYCDQATDGGGWTVFQRRRDGTVNFYDGWQSYKLGFGDLQNEFWLGNDNVFTMSLQSIYPHGSELRIELEDWSNVRRYAKYSSFQIGNQATGYEMHVSGYSGTAGDGGNGMSQHDGMKFSTFDHDNDIDSSNCAATYKGGWWYKYCHVVNLNGRYYRYNEMGAFGTGIHWWPFHGYKDYSLKVSEMKMRRLV